MNEKDRLVHLCEQKQNCELGLLSEARYCAGTIVAAINAGAVSVTVSVSRKAQTSPEQSSISFTVGSKFSNLAKVAAAGCISQSLFEVLDSDADEEVDEFNLMVDFGAKGKRQKWLEMKNDDIVIGRVIRCSPCACSVFGSSRRPSFQSCLMPLPDPSVDPNRNRRRSYSSTPPDCHG